MAVQYREKVELPVIWTSPKTAETLVDGERLELRFFNLEGWTEDMKRGSADGDFVRGESDLFFFNFSEGSRDRIVAEWMM